MILGMRQQLSGASPTVLALFLADPADYETLSTLSAMPTGGTISRSGNAMIYDSTGKLTWAPNNVCQRSQEFNDAYWSTISASVTPNTAVAPDGTTTADTLTATAANGEILRSTNAGAGTYILSVWIKRKTGTGQIQFVSLDGSRVNVAQTVTSTDWTRCFLRDTGTLSNAYIGVRLVTSGDEVYLWGAQCERVTYETTPRSYLVTTDAARYEPRFDVDPATGQAKGLLLEGARTNLVTYSQDFADASWNDYRSSSISAASFGSPDGTNARAIVEAPATATHFVQRVTSVAISNATVYTISIYAKANGRSFLQIMGDAALGNLGGVTTFNLSTGAVTLIGSGVTSANIVSVGNGWYRCSITAISAGTSARPAIGLSDNATVLNNAFKSYAGDGASGIIIWGAMIEAGAWPSSYLPTGASTLSRSPDTFTLTGYANRLIEAYWIEQETGVASSFPETVVSSGAVTINPPQFGWVTSLRAYQNAYAGDITTPSWIDNSGTNGNRMVTDSTGTLTWAPANLLLRSQDFANASWNKTRSSIDATPQIAPDGSSTATKLVEDTTASNNHFAFQTIATLAGVNYVASVYVKPAGRAWVSIGYDFQARTYFDVQNGTTGTVASGFTASIQSAGNGWYRCALVGPPGATTSLKIFIASGNNADSYTGDGTSGIYLWGAQLEAVTYQTQPRAYIPTTDAARFLPRYDYDAATTPASPRGMLIEEARSNLLTYSQDFADASWNDYRSSSISAASFTGPDAGAARAIVEAAATATHFVQRVTSVAISNATAYTVSIYAKANGRTFLQIMGDAALGNLGGVTTFNLSTGAVTLLGNLVTSASIVSVGNGWYRCSITATSTGTSARPGIGISDNATVSNTAFKSYAGDGASGIVIFGMMIEAGSFATSYIPTTSASVSRVADVVKLSGTALTTLQGGAGSVLAETNAINGAAGLGRIVGTDGTGAQAFLGYNGTTVVSSWNGTTNISATLGGSGAFSSPARTGVSWSPAGRSLVGNNGTVTTSATAFISFANAWLGGDSNSARYASGVYRSLALYNSRLPDATLQKKSTVGAAY